MNDSSVILLLLAIIFIQSAAGIFVFRRAPGAQWHRLFALLMMGLVAYDVGLLLAVTAVPLPFRSLTILVYGLLLSLIIPAAVLMGAAFLLKHDSTTAQLMPHQLLHAEAVGLLVFDAQEKLVEMNAAAARLLRLSPDVLQNRGLPDVWQMIAAQANHEVAFPVTTEAPASVAIHLEKGDAPPHSLMVHIEKTRDENGRILGVLLILVDHSQEHQQTLLWQQTNAELLEQNHFLTLLTDITHTAIASLDLQEMLQTLADRFGEIIHADGCYITLWDEEQQRVMPGAAYGPLRYTYHTHSPQYKEKTLTEHVLIKGQALTVEDTFNTPYLSLRIAQSFPSRSILALPLIVGEKKMGAVLVAFDRPRHFSPQDVQRGEQAAAQIALAIAKTHLLESERAQRLLAQTLQESGAALAAMLDFDAILDELLAQIGRVVPFDTACVLVVNSRGSVEFGRLHGYERFIPDIPGFLDDVQPQLGEWQALQWMTATHETAVIPNVDNSERWTHFQSLTYIRSWLGTPVIVKGDVLAFICLDHTTPNFYHAEHGARLAAFAGQVGLAMQNAQFFAETRRNAQELAHVGKIMRNLNATPQVETALTLIWPYLQQITGCGCAALWLKRDMTFEVWQFTAEVVDGPQERFLLTETAVSPSLAHTQPHLTPDLTTEISYPAEQKLFDQGFLSRIFLPLHVNERLIGGLNISWAEPAGYSERILPLLAQIGESLALATERSRLFQETRQHADELGILAEISAITRTADNTDDMLFPALYRAIQALRATYGAIFLRDMQTDEMVLAVAHAPVSNLPQIRLSSETSISRHVLLTGEVYQTSDLPQDPYAWHGTWEIEDLNQVKSLIVLPLRAQTLTVGLMHIASATLRHFSPEDVRLLTAIGDIVANALNRFQVLATLEDRVARRTQELANANERLQELDRLKSKFIADVSHELRTPITNLALYLDLLTRGRPERRSHYEQTLQEQVRRLQTLIDDTLSLSRLELGHDQVRYELVPLNEVIGQVVAVHQVKAEAAGLQLVFQPSHPLPRIWGEPNQLAQVVSNLIVNALNYTEQGFVRVVTGYEVEENAVFFQVEDSGQGIAAEDAPYLFQRFYRGQQTGQSNIPGTGLGLAIVKEIVDLHGGRIQFQSQVNVGSQFVVKLPVKDLQFETGQLDPRN